MPKIIRILRSCSMKIFCKFPTLNISKLNFWLVICIAKNFIWTTLKVIFSIFRFFCTLRFQIYKYCPIITNHTSMENCLFSFQMMHKSQFQKIDPYDWFCGPGSHLVKCSSDETRAGVERWSLTLSLCLVLKHTPRQTQSSRFCLRRSCVPTIRQQNYTLYN